MVSLLFYSLIFAIFINFTAGAMAFSSVNRTFLTMYKGVLESSISQVDKNGELVSPYFDKEKLEEYVTTYFDNNLPRYVDHYTASIYYINKEDETVCTSSYCTAVKITLECTINYLFHYLKARNFYVGAKE